MLSEMISSIPNQWKLLEHRPDDNQQVWYFRKNMGAAAIKGNEELSTLVYFTVGFTEKDASGLPSKSDVDILFDFEEKIIPLVESEASCILVASVTKQGIKDHLFYISDSELFLNVMQKHAQMLSSFQINLERVSDPNWQVYDDFPDGE